MIIIFNRKKSPESLRPRTKQFSRIIIPKNIFVSRTIGDSFNDVNKWIIFRITSSHLTNKVHTTLMSTISYRVSKLLHC